MNASEVTVGAKFGRLTIVSAKRMAAHGGTHLFCRSVGEKPSTKIVADDTYVNWIKSEIEGVN